MRKALLFILLIQIAGSGFAIPQFEFDYANFRIKDTELPPEFSYLQIYTMISRGSLTFEPSDSVFTAEYSVLVEIRKNDAVLTKSEFSRVDRAETLEAVSPNQKIPNETSFHIKAGVFTVSITVTDLKNGESRNKEKEITIEAISSDDLSVSDIEFASSIKRVQGKAPFTKNQLQIIPHAENLFGGDVSTAYYYLEVYNFDISQNDKKYIVKRDIYDEDRQLFASLPEKTVDQRASSVVEADVFSVDALPTGTYLFKIEIIDGITGNRASVMKKFWVFKPGEDIAQRQVNNPSMLLDEIKDMSDEEVAQELDYIRYLLSRSETKILKKVKKEGQRKFLFEFWSKRTEGSGFRLNYLNRIEEANIRYGTKIYEGWKTDRGRTMIVYGEPDIIERRIFEINLPEHEIWHYDQLEGGAVFLFSDLKGSGDLQQVYSSVRGEYIDARWKNDMENRNPSILMDIMR